MGGRVRSEDRERVSAGSHKWGTWDQVLEWDRNESYKWTRVWRSELVLHEVVTALQKDLIKTTKEAFCLEE